MLQFLHYYYFPRLVQAKLTLNLAKSFFFIKEIRVLGFYLIESRIRPSLDKVAILRDYLVPKNIKELEAFLYKLPFLSSLILGRAKLTTTIKTAITTKLVDPPPGKKKRQRVVLGFKWNNLANKAFYRAQDTIAKNVVNSSTPNLQYYLVTDASTIGASGYLF